MDSCSQHHHHSVQDKLAAVRVACWNDPQRAGVCDATGKGCAYVHIHNNIITNHNNATFETLTNDTSFTLLFIHTQHEMHHNTHHLAAVLLAPFNNGVEEGQLLSIPAQLVLHVLLQLHQVPRLCHVLTLHTFLVDYTN